MKNWSMIVAIGENYEIGKDNDLLWRISDDLKRFKTITTGHTIVMGRKTFESLPKGALPNRRNIVISRKPMVIENTEVFSSIEAVSNACSPEEKIFIIGGASIYKQTIDKIDHLYLTRVHASFDADVFFPEINLNDWETIQSEFVPANEKNQYDHTFEELIRKIL